MSIKRILIRIAMLLLLWGALFGMFTLTEGVNPWIRVVLGIVICMIYIFLQIAINRKMYGTQDGGHNSKKETGKEKQ